MVRLELKLKIQLMSIYQFQFLNGAIRIIMQELIKSFNFKFQFLNGAIRIKRNPLKRNGAIRMYDKVRE